MAALPSVARLLTGPSAGVVIFVVAALVRGSYLWALAGSPNFDHPSMDGAFNSEWAILITQGQNILEGAYFRAPFYSHFLAGFFWLFDEPRQAFVAIHVAQMLLGSLNCSLLYLLGKRLYGPVVGVLAGWIAAFYWILVYFEGELLLPVVLIFHLLMCLHCLVSAVERSSHGWLLGAGLFMGLFTITRPNILICLPPLLLWLYFACQTSNASPAERRRAWLGNAAALTLGVALCVAPVTLRNWIVADEFVLVASQGGVNFYIGNNPNSDGMTAVVPGTRATWGGGYEDTVAIAEQARGRELKASEVSSYWFGRGVAFLLESPGAALRLYLHKLQLLFNTTEISNNQNIYFFIHYVGVLSLPLFVSLWMLAPFALAGALTLPRNRWWWLLTGLAFTYLGSFLLFFVTARYRVPAIPILILLASAFLEKSWRHWKQGRGMRLLQDAGLVVGIGILLAVISTPRPEIDLEEPSNGHFSLGNTLYERGQLQEALAHFTLSARLGEPYRSRSVMQQGFIHMELGDVRLALRSFDEAIKVEPTRWTEVADYLIGRGRTQLAEEFLATLEGGDAYLRAAALKLGAAYHDAGRFKRAAEQYARVLAMFPRDAEAQLGYDEAMAGLGARQSDEDRAPQRPSD